MRAFEHREIADTSVDAYRAFRASPKLSRQQARIVEYLAAHPKQDFTRGELAGALGMRLSSVCGRVAELLHPESALATLMELPRRPCRITRIAAHPVRLSPAQRGLFE